ncbi:MAG: hypothetical protein L6Q31_10840 [Fimbriimonadaceae bacterium]|uniref:Outer membrane protein beta-barrel domain-containing protein n=1 Tax=Candidatus Nitrosymbiomonas proteolyticus TaxID=2608984 RepID=A0A809RHH0_9BACT|nr:hypothetical protein [Fimbriimonadaceae bacterium]NUM39606.1 hypothetical protein [Armatimonadota bacterium]BBO23925.1 conserved hypothetical protein [Candidatus Nitrosymbiomonas proteolyticus]
MKRSIWMGLALLALSGSALAQGDRSYAGTFRIGQFQPNSEPARSEGKTWTLVGVDFKVARLGGNGAGLTLSIDNYTKGDYSVSPALLNVLWQRDDVYFSMGVGASFNREYRIVGGQRDRFNKMRFAYQIGGGWAFQGDKSPLVVEAHFFGNEQEHLGGFAVVAGLRF